MALSRKSLSIISCRSTAKVAIAISKECEGQQDAISLVVPGVEFEQNRCVSVYESIRFFSYNIHRKICNIAIRGQLFNGRFREVSLNQTGLCCHCLE